MKVLGLTVGLIVLMASCQKEDLRPAGNPATPYMQKCSTQGNNDRTNPVAGRDENTGADGIVDPNADQDASGSSSKPRKGGK